MNHAKLIQVIETVMWRGGGASGDPLRTVKSLWTLEGKLLCEYDPHQEHQYVDSGNYTPKEPRSLAPQDRQER